VQAHHLDHDHISGVGSDAGRTGDVHPMRRMALLVLLAGCTELPTSGTTYTLYVSKPEVKAPQPIPMIANYPKAAYHVRVGTASVDVVSALLVTEDCVWTVDSRKVGTLVGCGWPIEVTAK
ncbi:MAG TPA: hypothetical protein VIV60_00830, partial [Polyangiaceae bacterium]